MARHDYIVVEHFNQKVQETKANLQLTRTDPTGDQAEDEESKQEQAFREWFA